MAACNRAMTPLPPGGLSMAGVKPRDGFSWRLCSERLQLLLRRYLPDPGWTSIWEEETMGQRSFPTELCRG